MVWEIEYVPSLTFFFLNRNKKCVSYSNQVRDLTSWILLSLQESLRIDDKKSIDFIPSKRIKGSVNKNAIFTDRYQLENGESISVNPGNKIDSLISQIYLIIMM